MQRRGFGELELAILSLLRERSRLSVREVFEALGSRGSYTTIMTVMSRLAEKGDLDREKAGRHYEYWIPGNTKNRQGVLRRLKERVFGGCLVNFVSCLIDSEDELSEKELEELQKLVEEKKRKRSSHE